MTATYEEQVNSVRAPDVTVCAESAAIVDAQQLPPDVEPKITALKTKVVNGRNLFKLINLLSLTQITSQDEFAYEAGPDLSAVPINKLDSITPKITDIINNLRVRSSEDQNVLITRDFTNGTATYFRGLTKCYRLTSGKQRDYFFRDKAR